MVLSSVAVHQLSLFGLEAARFFEKDFKTFILNMKNLDRGKFMEAVLNAGRQVGAGEAELMDPDEDSESDQC
jgi:hypothetical protein